MRQGAKIEPGLICFATGRSTESFKLQEGTGEL